MMEYKEQAVEMSASSPMGVLVEISYPQFEGPIKVCSF